MKKWPRVLAVIVPAGAFLVLLAIPTLTQEGPPRAGDAAPEFEAELLNGDETMSLGDLSGRPLVVNFWASWCVPCRDEAPMLKAAFDRYGDRVGFLGINIRDAISDARAFADETGMEWPSVRDEDLAIYDDYGLTGQPETFFIDDDGVIVAHVPGPLVEDDLYRFLDTLLARVGPPRS